MTAIRFTPAARAQFLSAVSYIQAERPLAAAAFRARAEKALRQLLRFPESGRAIPEFPDLQFREVLVDSHRFFYRTRGDIVWVVGVWHDAQLPQEPSDAAGV